MRRPTTVKPGAHPSPQQTASTDRTQQFATAVTGSQHARLMTLHNAVGNRTVSQFLTMPQPQASEGDNQDSTSTTTGRPLDLPTRLRMETRFGENFSQVRIHTGRQADAAAKQQRARAYTLGNDIVFAHQHYAPHTKPGQHLLAHELAHVLQQRQQRSPEGLPTIAPSAQQPLLERQAEDMAQQISTGQKFHSPVMPAPHIIQRSPETDAGDFTQATKSVAKIPFFKIPTRFGELSLKLAIAPVSAGKDKTIPKALTPEMEVEIAKQVSFKLKSDVFKYDFDKWPEQLRIQGFTGGFTVEFLEAEVANGATSLSVAKVKAKYQSTDAKTFGAAVTLEFELKIKPENLLRGKDRALLKQFQQLTEKLQTTVKEVADNTEKLKQAEASLRQAEEELAQNREKARKQAARRRGRGKQRQKINREVRRELEKLDDAAAKLEKEIKLHNRYAKNLGKNIHKGKGIIRRTTQQIGKVVRSSKNPLFRLMTKSMMKVVGRQLARFIPILNVAMLGYDLVVLIRNLALGRLSWNPFGDGDPWGDGIGEHGNEGTPDAANASAEATTSAEGQPGTAQGSKGAADSRGQGDSERGHDPGSPADTEAATGENANSDHQADTGSGVTPQPGDEAEKGTPGASESAPDHAQESESNPNPVENGGTVEQPTTPHDKTAPSSTSAVAKDKDTGAGGGTTKRSKKAKKESVDEATTSSAPAGKRKKRKRGASGAAETLPSSTTIFPVLSGFDPNKSYEPGDEIEILATFTIKGKKLRKRFTIVVDSKPMVQDGIKRLLTHNKTEWTFNVGDEQSYFMGQGESVELITTPTHKRKKQK